MLKLCDNTSTVPPHYRGRRVPCRFRERAEDAPALLGPRIPRRLQQPPYHVRRMSPRYVAARAVRVAESIPAG